MRLFLRLGLCVLVLNGLIGALIANRLHAQAPAPPGKADPPAVRASYVNGWLRGRP